MEVVNLARKFATFNDHYSPKIVGELNNFQVKLVKIRASSCGTAMTLKMRCSWL